MSTEEDPRFMESYLQHAMNVIDNAKHIPKVFFKEAKGVMLISAREGGFLVSNTSGTGVLVPHNKDGTWGMPMAVHLEGFGIGAVFGYANKDIIVIMNHFAMNRLLEGRGQTKLGVDMGFACGKLGGAVGVEAAISNKLGMGTSFIFSFSRGVLVDVEVSDTMIKAATGVNTAMYGGNVDCDAIVQGKVPMPGGKAGEMIQELHDKLTAHMTGEQQSQPAGEQQSQPAGEQEVKQ